MHARGRKNEAATKDDDVKGILDNDGDTWKQLLLASSMILLLQRAANFNMAL